MIINIRGTSGAGKTHLVRRIMELYDNKVVFRETGEKRKQPLGYILTSKGKKSVALIGHYESPCGGCDTITEMERIFNIVRKAHENGHHVIYEGLLISADIKRTAALHEEGLPLTVIALSTPLEECLASVNARRAARGKMEPVNPKNTESKHKGVQQSMRRFQERGVPSEWHDRDGAFARIEELLNVN